MSIEIIVDVLDSKEYRGVARLVMIVLANYADENGFAWPSIDIIAKKANAGKRSAIRVIEKLEDDGHLLVVRRRNTGNGYIVLTSSTRPRFPDAVERLCRWARLEISDVVALSLREPSRKMLQSLTPDPAAISATLAEISVTSAEISVTATLDPSLPVSEPNTTAQAQIETPVSSAAVPSESDKNKAFEEKMMADSRLINAQPQKHISAEERMAATKRASARGWAKRTSSRQTTHRLFERALEWYGDNAPALRELHEQIETNFGLAPDWNNEKQVKSWTSGLKEAWIASREDQAVVIAAGKYLREKGLPIASPRSFTNMARSIAAERATAYVAPSARAVKEYV